MGKYNRGDYAFYERDLYLIEDVDHGHPLLTNITGGSLKRYKYSTSLVGMEMMSSWRPALPHEIPEGTGKNFLIYN